MEKLLLAFVLLDNVMSESIQLKMNLMESNKNYCLREAKCEELNDVNCFGTTLPYFKTTNQLTNLTQLQTQEHLNLWKAIQSVPKCWSVIQPLLCAVYLPKCENDLITLPSQEMCNITRGPCRIIEKEKGWPDYLLCKQENYPVNCKNDLREMKFNTTAYCIPPLIETRFTENWIDGVEGCGLQCYNPFFTLEEHKKIHQFIAVAASLCLVSNLFTMFTFLIDWKSANKYPAVVIFYINICFMINCFGWLAQFIPESRRHIVCHQDGTQRQSEPRNGSNLPCLIVFILIYYSLIASIVWFVILAYTWNASFRSMGVPRETMEGKAAYFHMMAWSIPLILTIVIMALSEIDGNSIYGICFVGYMKQTARGGFLLAPMGVGATVGTWFLVQGLIVLIKVKINSGEIIKSDINGKIQNMILRIVVFILLSLFFVFCTLGCHVYEYTHEELWEKSLRDYIICSARRAVETEPTKRQCKFKDRMNITVIHLQLISVFGAGILMSSWICTLSSLDAWKRFFYRLFQQPLNKPVKLRRHQMIAKVFAERQQLNQGPFSVSLHSTHDDPVGMNIELNSIASQEISSTWAAAFPKFISRRGALLGGGSFGVRHHSSMSDISQRQLSVDSYGGRRQSLDSQLSVQISEQEWMAHALARHQRRKTRRERERLIRSRNRILPLLPLRRGSDTSQHSIIAQAIRGEKTMITKATSTGDLTQGVLFHRPPTSLFITRPLIQRQPINPPFTHGMTDNSHQGNLEKRSVMSNPCSNNTVPQQVIYPLYPNYDMFSLHPNIVENAIIPQKVDMYSCLPGSVGYPQYGNLPITYFTGSGLSINHEPLIPLHPMIDTSSEVEYFPIRISDTSDFYTDVDYLSHDETQILSAQRLIQKHQITAMGEYITPFPRDVQHSTFNHATSNPRTIQPIKKPGINNLQDIAELSERGSSVPRSNSVCRTSQTPYLPNRVVSTESLESSKKINK